MSTAADPMPDELLDVVARVAFAHRREPREVGQAKSTSQYVSFDPSGTNPLGMPWAMD
jgi:hypothetical protein